MSGSVSGSVRDERQAVFDKLNSFFDDRRATPAMLLAFLAAVEAQPHAKVEPVGAREEENEQRVLMNTWFEAADLARQNDERKMRASKYTDAREKNSNCIEGEKYGAYATEEDHCAICATLKVQCLDQASHFGDRGESPPDSVCVDCGWDFGNRYHAVSALALHVASRENCKKEMFEHNRRTRLGIPHYDAAQLAAFKRENDEREKEDKRRMQADKRRMKKQK